MSPGAPHAGLSPAITGLWQSTRMSGTVVPFCWSARRSASLVRYPGCVCPMSTLTRLASTDLPSCTARLIATFHELSAADVVAKRSGAEFGP